MSMGRIKTGLAVVGTCAALSIVLPPLAGLMNAVGSVTLLALGGYTAYRAWAWMETVVEASRPSPPRRTGPGLGAGPPRSRRRCPRTIHRSGACAGRACPRHLWPACEPLGRGSPGPRDRCRDPV